MNRNRYSHRDLAPSQSLGHRFVLDLERFDPLRVFGRAASDADLVTDMHVPIRQLDDGDPDPAEIIGHDADLLVHAIAPVGGS